MSIRLPLTTVIDKTFGPSATPGSASVAGVEVATFMLPQDLDNVLMKVQTASVSGTGAISALFQTTDDGGVTWYDVARSPLYGSANGATSITTGTALWISVPTIGFGLRTLSTASVISVGSVIGTGVIGSAAASTLAAGQPSGLPIMSQFNRIALIYSGNITTNDGVRVKVIANQQSATA